MIDMLYLNIMLDFIAFHISYLLCYVNFICLESNVSHVEGLYV